MSALPTTVSPTVSPLCLAVALLLAACSEPSLPGPPYRARILTVSAIDEATGAPQYELADYEFSTLTDINTLDGTYLQLFRGGELRVREIAGSIVVDGRFDGSQDWLLRYEVENDVLIPRDYPTLAMLSSYSRFEQVLLASESLTGIPLDELVPSASKLEVFFEPAIVLEGDTSATVVGKFNAFYVPLFKQFGLAQRSELEASPLAANPNVISHEFGHRLFDRAFFADQTPTCEPGSVAPLSLERFSVEYALSGINEGYGDFVAFSNTGSIDPFAEYDFITDRNFRDTSFVFDSDTSIDFGGQCGGEFYCIGTLFSRSLYQAMPALGLSVSEAADRQQLSREVYAALVTTFSEIQSAPDLLPAMSAQVAQCQAVRNHDYDGAVLSAFLRAFVAGLPAATRAPICDTLANNFGSTGFSVEGRGACPTP